MGDTDSLRPTAGGTGHQSSPSPPMRVVPVQRSRVRISGQSAPGRSHHRHNCDFARNRSVRPRSGVPLAQRDDGWSWASRGIRRYARPAAWAHWTSVQYHIRPFCCCLRMGGDRCLSCRSRHGCPRPSLHISSLGPVFVPATWQANRTHDHKSAITPRYARTLPLLRGGADAHQICLHRRGK
jgi:hypothetical protein